MKLYFSPGACSFAPHILLNEVGAKYQAEKVDIRIKQYSGGDFLKVNPKGYVPTLELDSGEILTEGIAIMTYISSLKPEAGLVPQVGTMPYYRTLEWLAYVSTEMHKTYSPLFSLERMFNIEEVRQQFRAQVVAGIHKKLDFLSTHLQEHPFLVGKTFTAPDAYLVTVLRWSKFLGIDLSTWPVLEKYMAIIHSRPSVQAAIKAEGLKG